MPSFYDPIRVPTPARNPEEFAVRRGKWLNWLSNPDTRAALMQFGVNALQPIAPGQTFLGHIGQGIGAAGETVARRADQREAQQTQALNRRLDVMGLGLRAQEARERTGIDRERLGLEAQDVATRRIAALRPAASAFGPEDIVKARQEADKLWADMKKEVPFGGPDPGDLDTFRRETLDSWGVPNMPTSSAPEAALTGGDLVAAPTSTSPPTAPQGGAGSPPPIVGAPLATPTPSATQAPAVEHATQKTTAELFMQRFAKEWAALENMVASNDPAVRENGRRLYQTLIKAIVDPQNLPKLPAAPNEFPNTPGY